MSSFGEKLKKLRNDQGLSQAGLGEKLGMGASTIGQYELGAREPDFKRLEEIKNYFGVDYNYLLGDEELQKDEIELKTLFNKYKVEVNGKKLNKRVVNGLLMILENR